MGTPSVFLSHEDTHPDMPSNGEYLLYGNRTRLYAPQISLENID
jgi:hypothetical protein